MRDADFREQVAAITAPTLIICGTADAVTTPLDGAFLQERIRGAGRVELHAAHLSNVEAGELFNRYVLGFLRA